MARSSGRLVRRFAGYSEGPICSRRGRRAAPATASEFFGQPGFVRHFHEQSRLQPISAGQQAVEQLQLPLHQFGFNEAGDAKHFLRTEPGGLAVLEQKGRPRADADAAITIEITDVRLEEFAATARVLVQEATGRSEGGKLGSIIAARRQDYRVVEHSRQQGAEHGANPIDRVIRERTRRGHLRIGTVFSHMTEPNQRAGLAEPPVRLKPSSTTVFRDADADTALPRPARIDQCGKHGKRDNGGEGRFQANAGKNAGDGYAAIRVQKGFQVRAPRRALTSVVSPNDSLTTSPASIAPMSCATMKAMVRKPLRRLHTRKQ